MNEMIVIKENELVDEGRVGEIVVEINAIRKQTMTHVLYASVEIGRLLCEAKEKMPHGAFGPWLAENFSYSQSSANNLMRLYRNYGEPDQLDIFFAEGERAELFGDLTPSQAIALLGMPEPERKRFVQEHDMEKTSVRDIEAEVKARREAERHAEELESELESERLARESEKEKAEKDLSEARKLVEDLKKQYDKKPDLAEEKKKLKEKAERDLQKKLTEAKRELEEKLSSEQKKRGELEGQLSEIAHKTKETLKAEYESRIAELEERAKSAESKLQRAGNVHVQKFAVLFEQFQNDHKALLSIIEDLKKEGETESADKLSGALAKILAVMQGGS